VSIFKDQEDFMVLGGQWVNAPGADKQRELYMRLIEEEAAEFREACVDDSSAADIVKEAVDVIVVATGYLVTVLGAERAQEAWNLVYESNLAKVQGGVEKREDGKILKNDEYKKVARAKLMAALMELVSR
jgi:hypothetical protein